jgi:hypothetical protein
VTSLVKLLPDVSKGSNASIIRIKTVQEETPWPWLWRQYCPTTRSHMPSALNLQLHRWETLWSQMSLLMQVIASTEQFAASEQTRHMQDKARFSASRSSLSFRRRWSRASHSANTDNYVPSTTRRIKKKKSSQDFITAFPYILWHLLPGKKGLVWRPRLSVRLRPTIDGYIFRPYSWNLCRVYVLQM